MTKRIQALAIFLPLVGLTAACSKNEEKVPLAAPAASLTVSKAPVEAKAIGYAIDPSGKSTIEMPAPKEHIKARTTAAGGSLEIDLANLANTRGEVKIDLTTLTTFTFGDKDKDEAQTEHARTWLEAVVDGKTNESQRWVVFAIRSVDGLSATDISKVTPTMENGEDVRSVTLMAHGDFLLHGRKSTKDAKLMAKMHWPAGAAADSAPTSIEIKSVTPLRVVLAEHEVKPRDTFGKVAQGSFHLLGTKVADTAEVTIDVRATKGNKS